MTGFLLVEGILSSLQRTLPVSADPARPRAIAGQIAPSNFASLPRAFPELATLDASGHALHAALVHGFGTVMLCGGIGVWVLAALSFAIFGRADATPRGAKTSGAGNV